MSEFKELVIATLRMILGLIVLIGALIVIDLVMYISFASSTSTETVTAAYYNGYQKGYADTYKVSYREALSEAYDKGYDQWLELGRGDPAGQGVVPQVKLRNPTYLELRDFLTRDETDSRLYVSGEYVCFDFAAALNNNAEASGIRAAYVRIRSREWAHAVVAFETTDRGLIFIEPQSDREVRMAVGEPYPWRQAGAARSTTYNDPVVEIQIIW